MAHFKLPDVGEGLTEAEIVGWKVGPGDVVEINQVIVEIETAKSLVELPSPYAGEVTALLVAEGETVAVGTAIIMIDGRQATPSPHVANPAPPDQHQLAEPVIPVGPATLVGYGPREDAPPRRRLRVALVEGVLANGGSAAAPTSTDPPSSPLAKPPVRKLAKDLGVELSAVVPSSVAGLITPADVEEAVTFPRHPVAGTASGVQISRESREPIRGVRKAMAAAMVSSAFTTPHVTEWVTCDVTRTLELVEVLRARPEFAEVRLTPLSVLARAAVLAIRRTPAINSFWDEAAAEVVLKEYVNLGIAAATPRGLLVPNVKEAQEMTLVELAAAINTLVDVARAGGTRPDDTANGTFTLTNIGVFGVDSGTPIINPGESAILALGAIRKQPWVVSEDGTDAIAIRQVATLALSFDHRHIDGHLGSQFLSDVAAIMRDPGVALLF
jgi:2-oxoisovalerate dehydrogenase E2 component (dihydrolipoyl transacylase)